MNLQINYHSDLVLEKWSRRGHQKKKKKKVGILITFSRGAEVVKSQLLLNGGNVYWGVLVIG